jgi:hypothetical protein
MTELWQLTRLIRSKNAGPWEITFDIMFIDRESYDRARCSGVLDAAGIAAIFRIPITDVQVFEHSESNSMKVTIPRSQPAGGPDDTDVFGCQFHGPLVRLEVG